MQKMVDWVRLYLCFEFDWDVRLILRKDDVPPLSLGQSGRLGWTSWLGRRQAATDAGDLCVNAEAFAAGRSRSQMSEINRAALFGKLNSLAYKAIEGATVFCKLRGNPYVELVHWMQQILQTPDTDLQRIIKHFELDPSRLAKDITDALDQTAARRHVDLRLVVARRERCGARMGVRHADVRGRAGADRLSHGRDDQDAVAAQRADRRSRGSSI